MDILVITDTPHVDNVALNSTVQPYFPFRVVTVAFPGRNALVFFWTIYRHFRLAVLSFHYNVQCGR